jgi:hypothetical protein
MKKYANLRPKFVLTKALDAIDVKTTIQVILCPKHANPSLGEINLKMRHTKNPNNDITNIGYGCSSIPTITAMKIPNKG